MVDFFEAYLETKNAAGLKHIMQVLNRNTLRKSCHKELAQMPAPSRTVLTELFFTVDVALMLLHRHETSKLQQHHAFHYFIVDSSPQGNRNWLLSKSSTVDASRCLELSALVNSLATKTRNAALKLAAGEDNDDEIDVILDNVSFLEKHLLERCCVPAAIGLSHANTAHKASAFLHSLMLEVEASSLKRTLVNTVSFTGDLGVEIGIPGFRSALEDLLPPWRLQGLQELTCEDVMDCRQSSQTCAAQSSTPPFVSGGSAPVPEMPHSSLFNGTQLQQKDGPGSGPIEQIEAEFLSAAPVQESRLCTEMGIESAICTDADCFLDCDAWDAAFAGVAPHESVSTCAPVLQGGSAPIRQPESSNCAAVAQDLHLQLDVDVLNAADSELEVVSGQRSESCYEGDLSIPSAAQVCSAATHESAINANPELQLLSEAWQVNAAWHGILMPFAMPIPGMLHITSNLLADVDSGMTYWSTFWEQLDNVSALLSNKQRLDKFKAMCIDAKHPDSKEVLNLFSQKIDGLYSKRWGSVSHFIAKCTDHLHALKIFWDAGLYGSHEQEDGASRFSPSQLSATLRCTKFFAYCEMVQLIHSAVDELAGWSEGCHCHPPWLGQAPTTVSANRFASGMKSEIRKALLGKRVSCPMQGRRSPEMAAGYWKTFSDKLLQRSFLQLSAAHQQQLDSCLAAHFLGLVFLLSNSNGKCK